MRPLGGQTNTISVGLGLAKAGEGKGLTMSDMRRLARVLGVTLTMGSSPSQVAGRQVG